MPKPRIIPAGEVIGLLTVTRTRLPGEGRVHVKCECGVQKTVKMENLGRCTFTCGGSAHRGGTDNGRYSHGMAGTRIYMLGADMVARCTRPTHSSWERYGGRGITVCDKVAEV